VLLPSPAGARDWGARGAVEPWIEVTTEEIARARLAPPRAARVLALVSVAARDAEVASRVQRAGAAHPAVAGAAATALAALLPERAGHLSALEAEAARAAAARGLPEAVAQRAVGLGAVVARRAVARSRHDGSDATGAPAPPAPAPGVWVPTPPAFAEPLEPLAGTWRPWNLPSGAALRPPPPPAPRSAAYAEEVRAVHAASLALTDEQRGLATFWADGPGTVTPPGHWNHIALAELAADPRDPAETARLFAALNTAQADAFIACWEAKYHYWLERPVTAIQREIDPGWEPLLPTPPFPAYPSGHATTSGAAAAVLGLHFPASALELAGLAQNAADSRLYGGIHFPVDSSAGLMLGREVGEAALARWVHRP